MECFSLSLYGPLCGFVMAVGKDVLGLVCIVGPRNFLKKGFVLTTKIFGAFFFKMKEISLYYWRP